MSHLIIKEQYLPIIKNLLDIIKIKYEDVEKGIKVDKLTSIKDLKDINTYSNANELWNQLVTTITYLETYNLTIPYINPDEAWIIDNKCFLPLNIVEIENSTIEIPYIFDKSRLYAKELNDIVKLPARIDYRAVYTNMAKIIVKKYSLKDKAYPKEERPEELNLLFGSKLYWQVYWNLDEDPENRGILVF